MMIILEDPYVSQYLIETIKELELPVLQNSVAQELAKDSKLNFLSEQEFIAQATRTKIHVEQVIDYCC
ncbi:MAG: hypothetical protein ACQEQI_03375 [Bacillota bacterium]